MLNIATTVDRYGENLESATIVVTGLQRTRFSLCHLGIIPEGREGRQVYQGPMVPGPWGFTVPHCLVIDNHGGSKREADEAPYRVEVGQPFTVEGLPGVWTFRDPETRRLEGDGPKLEQVEATDRTMAGLPTPTAPALSNRPR